MPLPSDEKTVKTASELVELLQGVFGKHPGFRPAHAKGIMLSGKFVPSDNARSLTTAPHFNTSETKVVARFSNSTGIPVIPDNDPNANPRGLAIRFQLGDRVHTDIIGHSTPYFPTRTGEEFIAFLQALGASQGGGPSPTPIEKFLGEHPGAAAFVKAPKPTPTSYAKEAYYSVNAYKFTNADGKDTHLRYRVIPELGHETLDEEAAKAKDKDFLQKEIADRVATSPVSFKLVAQLAEPGDTLDDATVHWPADRSVVELGVVTLDAVVPDNEKEAKHIIYDTIPRVKGIEATADPLLELRAAIYLLSGRQRRAA